ncbi:unnamed protein product [Mytilus coruscus]|uniref:Uncharacterized protein n=1 Tax=Mytilus coruscus TaxID=42192 RepID=A0A6J8BNL2_MYTCO|nr:unnamed protein product [Mytilus coruscus]
MLRRTSKKGTPARGQGVKRRRMADPMEKETASEVNHRSSGESVIDFSSVQGPSQTSSGTEPNSFNENIQFSQSLPCLEESLFDQIGRYVPMKLKDKIWKHEFIDLSLLIKSTRELTNFPDQEGDLVLLEIKGQSNESKVGFSSQSEPFHSFRQSSGQQNFQQPRTCNAYNTKRKRCNLTLADLNMDAQHAEVNTQPTFVRDIKISKQRKTFSLGFSPDNVENLEIYLHDYPHLESASYYLYITQALVYPQISKT